jgi:hypothetical protein
MQFPLWPWGEYSIPCAHFDDTLSRSNTLNADIIKNVIKISIQAWKVWIDIYLHPYRGWFRRKDQYFFVVGIIGHCEKKKNAYVYVSNSKWLPRWSCWNEKRMVTQKKKLFAVKAILILFVHDKYRSRKFVTFHNNFSKISLSSLMHFANSEWRMCFVRLGWTLRFFMRAAASEMRATNSCCVSIFLLQPLLFKQHHKQKF